MSRRTTPFGQYLSPIGLEQLKAYKYVSAPLSSWVDQKMTHYWEWAVTLLPMWLAPNLVTTFSFAHAVFAHLLIHWYSPNLVEVAPRWAYILVALCLFLYQTLDAIDGKQARRTKNGSPLGQLFDHGCDAVTSWIIGIFVAATVQCGPSPLSYVVLLMVLVPFFAANWEESCTSVFRFGIVGVTEGQFIVMGIELLAGVFGPDVWSVRIGPDLLGVDVLPSVTVFTVVLVSGVLGGIYQVLSSLWVVSRYYAAHPNEDRHQAIASGVQYTLGIALATLWVIAPSDVLLHHPRLLFIIIGCLCSYQASRLIICHTTGDYYSWCFAIMWPLPIAVANEWSGRLLGKNDSDVLVDQTMVCWAYLTFVAVLYIHFVYVTIDQITSFLGIRCFKIKPHVASA